MCVFGTYCRADIDIVVLDFSKAIDKVSHSQLSLKLKYYGIWGRYIGKIQPRVMYYIQIYAGCQYQRELAIIELCECTNVRYV